jgi:membrane protease YdiL (CAAX protease family)
LLFRGLIGGALFRRLAFWKANLIQSLIFMAPHLLILLVAPTLWPLAIVAPLLFGQLTGWLRHSSGSIGPAVIIHAVSNSAGALWALNWSQGIR